MARASWQRARLAIATLIAVHSRHAVPLPDEPEGDDAAGATRASLAPSFPKGSTVGVRVGLLARAIPTALPGAFRRQWVAFNLTVGHVNGALTVAGAAPAFHRLPVTRTRYLLKRTLCERQSACQ